MGDYKTHRFEIMEGMLLMGMIGIVYTSYIPYLSFYNHILSLTFIMQ
jgi:hypothetical protein